MPDFTPVFAELRAIMLAAAKDNPVAKDAPGDLVVHTTRLDKNGKPEWFGAVAIKKTYVSYHLFPLYTDPSLGAGMSDALAKRQQGKSCFNFKTVEPELFAELAALTQKGSAAA